MLLTCLHDSEFGGGDVLTLSISLLHGSHWIALRHGVPHVHPPRHKAPGAIIRCLRRAFSRTNLQRRQLAHGGQVSVRHGVVYLHALLEAVLALLDDSRLRSCDGLPDAFGVLQVSYGVAFVDNIVGLHVPLLKGHASRNICGRLPCFDFQWRELAHNCQIAIGQGIVKVHAFFEVILDGCHNASRRGAKRLRHPSGVCHLCNRVPRLDGIAHLDHVLLELGA
mmetsp:Transcript_109515/g.353434  ORF Transcript_109515/g.353434 Transcript_109515/m.353434 type:complete len:223 (+) Transcript_109515:1214-1882(+)